ncbi:MAG TPA: T9SS type A sorting domain-containing protein [Bacteroidota bacterium]|jgi:hypothetical protein|nr:T9SS type A sorting domain-containing protein [Bacteroidota bacterium]
MNNVNTFRGGKVLRFSFIALSLLLFSCILWAQPRYRTFSQSDLALKKAKHFGKRIASIGTFTFPNDSAYEVNSLHAKFNSGILEVIDSGGFTAFPPGEKNSFDASGRTVAGGSSVEMTFKFHKKDRDIKAEKWWWDTNSVRIGMKYKNLHADTVIPVFGQPNGGTVLDYLYKRIIERPEGVTVGLPTDTPQVGWIQYNKSDRKYFPHGDSSRCFDYIGEGDRPRHLFNHRLKNPHVKKHNNHLLGELHSLKLAIIANDSGVTEPLDVSTRLGDLTYDDGSGPGNPCNGKTLRDIAALTDSGLTYCSHFTGSFYFDQDSCISRINRAFDGPYVALTFHPMTLAGTNPLPSFLHPGAAPAIPHAQRFSPLDLLPDRFELQQNYPNPFNPSTTIEFSLPEASLVTLKIYNLLGEDVATVLESEEMDEGEQSVDFDGSVLPSGVYFYRLTSRGIDAIQSQFQSIKRMVLIK